MHDVFRSNLKRLTPFLWLVIVAFVMIEYSVFARNRNVQRQGPDATAASVLGRSISFREFENAYRQKEQEYRDNFGEQYTPEVAKQLGVARQVMDELLNREVLIAEAERLGLRPTVGELRTRILDYPVFKNDAGGFGGAPGYRRILRRSGLSVDEFERGERELLALQRLLSVIQHSAFVSDAELERAARERAEQAEILYLLLPSNQVGEVPVTDAEVAAQFEANRESYRIPERRRVGYAAINSNQVRAELKIEESELRDYYDANLPEFTRPEQVRARHILLFGDGARTAEQARAELQTVKEKLARGGDFAALARELSEDEATRERGGDLGFFGRGQMTPAFEEAAFSATPGALVGPIENQLGPRVGFHLLEVQEKQSGGTEPFETARNRIEVRLLNERARERSESRARELHIKWKSKKPGDAAALAQLAQQEGVPFEQPEPFGQNEVVPNLGRGGELQRAVFEQSALSWGEPVRVPAGWAIPVVLEVIPARVPGLDEVRDRVRADLVAERQKGVGLERLAAARERISRGETTLDQAAAELGLALVHSGSFGARGTINGLGREPALIHAALALPVGALGAPVGTANGAALFEVLARTQFDPIEFAATKNNLRSELEQQRVNQLQAALIARRRLDGKASYSRRFVETFEDQAEPRAAS